MIKGVITGVPNVAKLLNQVLPQETEKQLAATVKSEAQKILSIATANVPVKTGVLRSEIKIKSSGKGLNAKIGVFKSSDRGFVARFLEWGTKSHRELPKNRKALAFGGRYAAFVINPGLNARGWLLGATKGEKTNFQQQIRQAMIAALRKVSG